jgi:hypothetical protein
MSRSYKKTPVSSNAIAHSEKQDKAHAHRALRADFRVSLAGVADPEAFEFDERNEAHSNIYTFAKDGKHRFGLRVAHVGRATRVLAKPKWVKDDRQAHRLLAK